MLPHTFSLYSIVKRYKYISFIAFYEFFYAEYVLFIFRVTRLLFIAHEGAVRKWPFHFNSPSRIDKQGTVNQLDFWIKP